MSNEQGNRIEQKVDGLGVKVGELDQRLQATEERLSEDIRETRARCDDLGHQMRVLHEDLVDRIKALAPDYDVIDGKIARGDAEVRTYLLRRIEPIEAAVRMQGRE